ncbi:MAG: CRISPR-associated protein Cas4 [Chloroflexi bacterium]|jgi:CRISPR-associated exonuclease Cas4|uniref:CRISPR-associated exonuclease Cas4 n=1 Tax=Candidatus Thermofonsia Clade 3 bacterium TaxID=2364212 RepID=A0A2M8QA18_9CHLR|nr:CRISPR-associated protein Cas4 [Candidatus Roseilinea sp. NK_OTU-006]PJF46631.1 MAG: CRISPR-associated protein Cas4 [Candidatus Thermofonsia Clade 3 bacterium]RMG61897.1 MAG: CRISPR-associated protein Cas4 [Chloroflexota bacterium]
MFTVTDLKQLAYCARLVYYGYCWPGVHLMPTAKMASGRIANVSAEIMEHRRSLRAYGLRQGEREFDVWLESESLNLCGRLDMLIVAPSAEGVELIPVDYKDSLTHERTARRIIPTLWHNWSVQLAAYAILVEQQRSHPVRRGFIYYIPQKRAREVMIDERLRAEVQDGLRAIESMVATEQYPPPTPYRRRCAACEYRRLCNDI